MEDAARLAILEEIAELSVCPIRQEGDFSWCEYAEVFSEKNNRKIGRGSVVRRLRVMVDDGVLETGLRYDKDIGRAVRVWWRA